MKIWRNVSILLITIIALINFILPSEALASEPNTIAVTGEANITATPDIATLSLGVWTRESDAIKAYNNNSKSVRSILDSLKALGISSKDMRTNSYYFSPDYRDDNMDGFVVENSVTVLVRDINLLGRVIDVALKNGANKINSLDFNISDTSDLYIKVLQSAIDDARLKADTIAKKLGVKIISVQSVVENTGYSSYPDNHSLVKSVELSSAAPVETGMLSFTANVYIQYIIE